MEGKEEGEKDKLKAEFIVGMAHKICTEEGVWFRHPESNLTWSNYTTCVDVEDLEVNQ